MEIIGKTFLTNLYYKLKLYYNIQLMGRTKSPKLSFSIADLPLNISLEKAFEIGGALKFDGTEVLVGMKTGISPEYVERLSLKYLLPVLSIHQAIWSVAQIYRDKSAFGFAKYFQVPYVAHIPFPGALTSVRTRSFFQWLANMQKEFGIKILVENTAPYFSLPVFNLFTPDTSTTDLVQIKTICEEFGLGMTLDTSHTEDFQLFSSQGLQKTFSLIGNIHLSDFVKGKQHLPLGEGSFDWKKFLQFLKSRNYSGLITLELTPQIFRSEKDYTGDIQTSIERIRQVYDR